MNKSGIWMYAKIPHLCKNLDLYFKIAESETSDGAGRALCLWGRFAKIMAVRDSVEDLIGGVPEIRYQVG